jgi:uncharacterized protein
MVDALRERGDQVVALSRDRESARRVLGDVEVHVWANPKHSPPPEEAVEGADAVVHLLGEPIAQRWTSAAKREIRDSRVLSTRCLAEAISAVPAERRPGVLVSQSASGYYGARGDEQLGEDGAPGDDFLARVTTKWEREASAAARVGGVRVVMTRTGVVLSPIGGALEKMLPPFRLGVGGPVAGGRQYVPWIHIDDVVAGMLRCIDDERLRGPVNLTAPMPVTNAELSHKLGAVLQRPSMLPVPGLALRLMYGEMALVIATGQRAVPGRLLAVGHEFTHPEFEPALRDVLSRA